MNILHVETGRHLYGGAQQVLYLLQGLREDPEFGSILVCPRDSAVFREGGRVADQVYPLPVRGEADPAFPIRLIRVLRRMRPDLVHVHSRRGADVWGGLAARICGIPAVLTRRVDNPEPGWLARRKYSLYHRVIAISRGIREVLLRQGVPDWKITCVPSAVDIGVYGQECDLEWFRSEFGLAPGDVPVGMIAQFIERKGHRHLIRALPEILRACPDVRVLLFGQGPLREEVGRELQRAGLDGRTVMAGFRSDLHRILPCLRLVVHPALMEGLGVSLLQAAAAGVPIVAFDAGGIPEIVLDGYNGYLVSACQTDGLAQAVISLVIDRARAVQMGKNGIRLATDAFSINAMVAGNTAVYREVLRV